MPSRCAICDHPMRRTIEAAVASGRPAKHVASDLGLSDRYQSIVRHLRNHVGVTAPSLSVASTASQPPSESPVEVFRSAFGSEPHDWQVEYLLGIGPTVVRKGRQVGATQAAAALAIYTARSRPGADAVVISPSQRQSSEITVRARIGLWELGDKLAQDSAGLIRLGNGSRIISLPGNSRGVRGYAPALVVVDEAAWVADDTFTAVRPLVSASGGRLIVQSTPGSPVGFFYDLATNTPDEWTRLVVRSADVPTIDPQFLAREQREMPPALYAQEYEAEFQTSTSDHPLWAEDDWLALIKKQ